MRIWISCVGPYRPSKAAYNIILTIFSLDIRSTFIHHIFQRSVDTTLNSGPNLRKAPEEQTLINCRISSSHSKTKYKQQRKQYLCCIPNKLYNLHVFTVQVSSFTLYMFERRACLTHIQIFCWSVLKSSKYLILNLEFKHFVPKMFPRIWILNTEWRQNII